MKGYPFRIGQRIWLSSREETIPYGVEGTVASGVVDECPDCGAACYRVEFDYYPFPRSNGDTWWLLPDDLIEPFDEGRKPVEWDGALREAIGI